MYAEVKERIILTWSMEYVHTIEESEVSEEKTNRKSQAGRKHKKISVTARDFPLQPGVPYSTRGMASA